MATDAKGDKIKIMAKEQNGTGVVTETINGNLVLIREPVKDKNGKQLITKDGRLYYSYKVRGNVLGHEKKADFVPRDMGGYEPLDVLFEISPKAEIIMRDEVMTSADGRKTPYTTYTAQVTDEDGEVWECGVKPQRDSDKSLLKFMLIGLHKQTPPAA